MIYCWLITSINKTKTCKTRPGTLDGVASYLTKLANWSKQNNFEEYSGGVIEEQGAKESSNARARPDIRGQKLTHDVAGKTKIFVHCFSERPWAISYMFQLSNTQTKHNSPVIAQYAISSDYLAWFSRWTGFRRSALLHFFSLECAGSFTTSCH